MSVAHYKSLVPLASDIAEKSAGPEGFVTINSLRLSFGAEVEFRPLLVEGVIARPKEEGGKWKVLIDSETHPYSAEALAEESQTKPLPPRLRNTLAHELAHTLAFRADELKIMVSGSREEAVKALERETEHLSPLLLIPYSALQRLCAEPLSAHRLAAFRGALAVSNEVLIRRLEALRQLDDHPLRFSPRLSDIAVGIGERKNGAYILSTHPVFSRFSGLVPTFVHGLRNKQAPSLAELFTAPDFVANGGSRHSAIASVDAGTNQNPSGDSLTVEFQIEALDAKKKRFLWLLRKVEPGRTHVSAD